MFLTPDFGDVCLPIFSFSSVRIVVPKTVVFGTMFLSELKPPRNQIPKTVPISGDAKTPETKLELRCSKILWDFWYLYAEEPQIMPNR